MTTCPNIFYDTERGKYLCMMYGTTCKYKSDVKQCEDRTIALIKLSQRQVGITLDDACCDICADGFAV